MVGHFSGRPGLWRARRRGLTSGAQLGLREHSSHLQLVPIFSGRSASRWNCALFPLFVLIELGQSRTLALAPRSALAAKDDRAGVEIIDESCTERQWAIIHSGTRKTPISPVPRCAVNNQSVAFNVIFSCARALLPVNRSDTRHFVKGPGPRTALWWKVIPRALPALTWAPSG